MKFFSRRAVYIVGKRLKFIKFPQKGEVSEFSIRADVGLNIFALVTRETFDTLCYISYVAYLCQLWDGKVPHLFSCSM